MQCCCKKANIILEVLVGVSYVTDGVILQLSSVLVRFLLGWGTVHNNLDKLERVQRGAIRLRKS